LSVCQRVCNVGGLRSRTATQRKLNEHMTGLIGALPTRMPKPTRIVASCDPEIYRKRPVGYENKSRFALRRHPTAACRAISASAEFSRFTQAKPPTSTACRVIHRAIHAMGTAHLSHHSTIHPLLSSLHKLKVTMHSLPGSIQVT